MSFWLLIVSFKISTWLLKRCCIAQLPALPQSLALGHANVVAWNIPFSCKLAVMCKLLNEPVRTSPAVSAVAAPTEYSCTLPLPGTRYGVRAQ